MAVKGLVIYYLLVLDKFPKLVLGLLDHDLDKVLQLYRHRLHVLLPDLVLKLDDYCLNVYHIIKIPAILTDGRAEINS